MVHEPHTGNRRLIGVAAESARGDYRSHPEAGGGAITAQSTSRTATRDSRRLNRPRASRLPALAAPLTETLLLGVIGSIMGPGTELTWDADKMTTGNAEADKWVTHNYRDGWSL